MEVNVVNEDNQFEKAEDIVNFTVSKRYWYLRNSSHTCPSCKREQQLSQFWNTDSYTENCKTCIKEQNNKETYDIVLSVLSNIDLEDL